MMSSNLNFNWKANGTMNAATLGDVNAMSIKNTGKVGIGTNKPGDSQFCIQSTGYAHSNDQHKTQLSLENSKNPVGGFNSKMCIGVMDDGKGTIQILQKNEPTGYKDLLLQNIDGNVGIGTNSASKGALHVGSSVNRTPIPANIHAHQTLGAAWGSPKCPQRSTPYINICRVYNPF